MVCEGFWRRRSPLTCTDITRYYQRKHRDWYGVPRHKVMILLTNGSTLEFEGTFKSTRCLKLAVNTNNTPTGTMTCNQCARVPTLQSFVSMTQRLTSSLPAKKARNSNLSREALMQKLVRVNKKVRNLQKMRTRQIKRKRTVAAKEPLIRDDVKKFCKELQYIAQRGTLEDKRVMWSYLQDTVRCEYLKSKRGPKGAHGMRSNPKP